MPGDDAEQIAESANCPLPAGVAGVARVVERIKSAVVQDICELTDYLSPDDQPDLLQCTVKELDIVLERNLRAILTNSAKARDYYAGLYAERCGDLLASGRDETTVTIPHADLDAAIEVLEGLVAVLDAELNIKGTMFLGEYARMVNAHIGVQVVILSSAMRSILAKLKGLQ